MYDKWRKFLKCSFLCFCFDCVLLHVVNVKRGIEKKREKKSFLRYKTRSDLNNKKNIALKIECDCNTLQKRRLYNVPINFLLFQRKNYTREILNVCDCSQKQRSLNLSRT